MRPKQKMTPMSHFCLNLESIFAGTLRLERRLVVLETTVLPLNDIPREKLKEL